MSDTMQNPTTNPTPTQGNPGGNDGKNNNQKENFLVSGFKRVKSAVSDGFKAIKAHPVTHGICAALGVTAGGYVAYKVATSMNVVPEPPAVPQIAEPEKEEEQEQTSTTVEYVDIPETTTTEE